MTETQQYRVTGPLVTVKAFGAILPGSGDRIFQTIHYGGILPPGVDADKIDHLLAMGAIEPIGASAQ